MIERFNFYDIYGYLIPGFIWLLLLGLPLHLVLQFHALSAAELTGALAVAYVVGHVLAGVARQALATEKYTLKDVKDPVSRSVAILSPDFPGKNPLPTGLRARLSRSFHNRFGFNPIDPFDADGAKEVFFLCRAALLQKKAGAYVEQYQGMESLTRSLAVAFRVTAWYYVYWAALSVVAQTLTEATLRGGLPLVTLVIAVVVADNLDAAANREAEREKREGARFRFAKVECSAFATAFLALGAAGAWWYPLDSRQAHELGIAAALLFIGATRLKNASASFDESMALAVYRDFVVLSTGTRASTVDPWDERGA